MSGASVYRIPSAQEVKQFTFEHRELIYEGASPDSGGIDDNIQ
jgi:hypothetical protein